MRKKIISVSLVFLYLILFSQIALAEVDISADSAFLMESATGQVLYQKNSDQALPPASITKIMTLLIVFEALEEGDLAWDELVTVSENAWRMQGSQMFLEIGQQVTVRDLVQGISIISGNDACVAIAEHLYGREAAFVQVMNKKAQELGLQNSQFQNTTGWPAPDHYMSAQDIANLARYLINTYPEIIEFEAQKEFTFNNIRQFNRNTLLGRYPGADGLKTGWTTKAGHCLVGTAKKDDLRMISVVLNTVDEESRLSSSQELLDYGFYSFEPVQIAEKGTVLGEVDIIEGRKKALKVTVAKDFNAFIPIGSQEEMELVLKGSEDLHAPVKKGDVVGMLEIQVAGKKITTTDLVAQADLKRANFIVRFFRRLWTRVFA